MKKISKKNQLKLIDQATDSAMKQVEKERGQKKANYIYEWFRYIELSSEKLRKYLN
tara:strand:+ start:777 stop:944 length:168 start_codon:yes stop_codon:yes gene_type:complete